MSDDLMADLEAPLVPARAAMVERAAKLLKSEGFRIVKLEVEDTDPGSPEWTTYYVTEEL